MVNTASMAGVTALPLASAYHMSKHAVLALSECLHHELTQLGSKVKVSALCPEIVATSIDRAERNRPDRLKPASWEDQSGQKKYMTEVVVNDLQMLDSRGEAVDRGAAESGPPLPEAPSFDGGGGGGGDGGDGGDGGGDDDLPF